MNDNKTLRFIYTFFVGILLAMFVGVGINTFYAAPPPPKPPAILNVPTKELNADQITAQKQLDSENEKYQATLKPYNRNVSILSLCAAVIFLILSIILEPRIEFMSNGLMLGGLFDLMYGIGRGFASEDSKYIFAVVSVGLVIVLYLGYHRFVQQKR